MNELIKVTEQNGKQLVSDSIHEIIETWHYNEEYPNYIISSFGRVKKCNSNELLKIYTNNSGYKSVSINTLNKRHKLVFIHRLVAETFIQRDNSDMIVNHINGIKTDNRSVNLEWCTYSKNNKHAYEIGLKKGYCSNKGKRGFDFHLSKSVKQYSINMEFIKEYGSLRLANDETGVARSTISSCAKGKYKQAGGYVWRF